MTYSKNLQQVIELVQEGYSSFGIASCIMLTWIMKTDGRITKEEMEVLDDFSEQFNLRSKRQLFDKIIIDFDLQCIELASELLQQKVDGKGQRLVLDLFLGMVIADGYITYTEMYIIEFIADLFSISPVELDKIFTEATGRSKIEPGNPSSAHWWKSRKNKKNQDNEESKHEQSQKRSKKSYSTKRMKALAILGLDKGAREEEIKKTFRLLTKIHHPDRFHNLGEEAQAGANSTYIRIKDAYEYLMAS